MNLISFVTKFVKLPPNELRRATHTHILQTKSEKLWLKRSVLATIGIKDKT